jgi:hypothetical protein
MRQPGGFNTGIDASAAARVLWLKSHPLLEIPKRTQFANCCAMTSYRQIEANRRNALKSTGPKTEAGKQVSRWNAVRHGLTAETVIGALEDAEDYKAFEAAITADYDAQSAVELELMLRLASVLWRLRRATTMETGLFEIQAAHLRERRQIQQLLPRSRGINHALFRRSSETVLAVSQNLNQKEAAPQFETTGKIPSIEFASCFLRLANLPNFVDRLSRYEANLWRQAALDRLDRRRSEASVLGLESKKIGMSTAAEYPVLSSNPSEGVVASGLAQFA